MPAISQPRTECSGLTRNGQSWGAGRDFRSAWGMTLGGTTLEAWRASVGYAPAHYATAHAQFLDKRQAAAEPRAGRRAPASLVEGRPRSTALCWWRAKMIRGRRRPRPDAHVLNSEKRRQDAAQRRTAQEHPPIGGCQPEQPAFAHHATDHRCARCETGDNIAPAGENGCSAKATARLKRRAGR